MKLDLSNLKKYEKLILSTCQRTGNFKMDSLMFDFDNSRIVFHYDREFIFLGEVKFEFTVEEGEEYSSKIFLNSQKFFAILQNYENTQEINCKWVNKLPMFINGRNTYQIQGVPSNMDEDLKIITESELTPYTFSGDIIKVLKEAVNFLDSNSEDINSISILNNKVIALTSTSIYESKIDFPLEEEEEVKIHNYVVKFLSFLEDVSVEYDEENLLIKEDSDNIKIIFKSPHINTYIPEDSEVDDMFESTKNVVVDATKFTALLKSFDPFYDEDSKPINFDFKEEEINLSTVSDYDHINQHFKLVENNECKDFVTQFNANTVRLALGVLDKEVKFYVSDDKKGAIFTSGNEDKKVYLVSLKQE